MSAPVIAFLALSLLYSIAALVYAYRHPAPPGAFEDFEELR